MMKKHWRFIAPAFCAALMASATLCAAGIRTEATGDKDPRASFSAAQEEQHYLEGAMPQVDGKVVFRREIPLAGLSQAEIFNKVKAWLEQPRKKGASEVLDFLVTEENAAKGTLKLEVREYIVFTASGLSLDRAQFATSQQYTCLPGKCIIELSNLRYHYENTNRVAEGWITDDYALSKDKTSIYRGVRKMRVKTIDWADELFDGLLSVFSISQVSVPTMGQVASTTPHASPYLVTSQTAPVVPVAPVIPLVVPSAVENIPSALSDQTRELAGYKRLDPERIPGNIVKMLGEDGMLITAGRREQFTMMTAKGGGLGVLFGKAVSFCFVSPLSYVYSLLEQGDTYTLSFYTEAYREALNICSLASEKDADKVKQTGLTPLATPSGAQAFSEAWMVIECRKMAVQPLSPSFIVDPTLVQEFKDKPTNTLFVGEILNVWIK